MHDTAHVTGAHGSERAGRHLALHTLSNLLLGAAVGLAAYYGVTNLQNALEQSQLATQLQVPSAAATPVPLPVVPATLEEMRTQMDFSGWGEQDAAAWKAIPEGGAFARIVAPAMGLDAVVVKGTRTQDLKKGPGWIVRTDLPGETGNVGISGHRTTYGHPFGRIDELKIGDTVDVYSRFRRYRYAVERTIVVRPNRVDVIAHTETPQLTMTACHPPYSAAYRIVVQAKLVDVRRVPEPAGAQK
jgi:LPXTG-site transpeptidase (sortase) family protein